MRLIAGDWRGRKLEFIVAPGLRPTPDRVRETLFNWLQPTITGARCLDLFAGSGALGFEAASRGAKHVTLVDSNRELCQKLRFEVERFGAHNIEVVHRDAFEFLTDSGQFDIFFLDPPFAGGVLEKVLKALGHSPGLLRDGSLVYIESDAANEYEVRKEWQLLREGKAGAVAYRLYRATTDTKPEEV